MPGSVKNKIRWGTFFLFLLVLLSGGFSIYYIVKLKLQSENISLANYESLEYAHKMQRALDNIQTDASYLDSFDIALKQQECCCSGCKKSAATDPVSEYECDKE